MTNKKNTATATTAIVSTQTTAIAQQDKWADEQYTDTNAILPQIQALRGETPDSYGYFVREEILAAIGWGGYGLDERISYSYLSGNTEKGILLQQPRMLVYQTTPLMMLDVAASDIEKRAVLLPFDSTARRANPQAYKPATGYELILLDKDNQPLHDNPIGYLAKGSNGATFQEEWKKLVASVTACHAMANKIPVRPRTAEFNALCVFAPTLGRVLSGSAQKSFALKVTGFEKPSTNGWEKYFVGRSNPELAETIGQLWFRRSSSSLLLGGGAEPAELMD